MKKLVILSLFAAMTILAGLGTPTANAMTFSAGELATFGAIYSMPLSAPTTIPLFSLGGSTIVTTGSVDFAVLYNSSTSIYSYFYQVENIGNVGQDDIGRLTISNPQRAPILNSGIMGDSLESLVLFSTLSTFGANLGTSSNPLSVGEKTNRFYFQFAGPPGVTTGYLQNDGQGFGPVVGPSVPEPTTMLLFGMGVLGLFGIGKKKA